jgi:hypothetical protein
MKHDHPAQEAIRMRVLALSMIAVFAVAAPASAQFRQQAEESSGVGITADLVFSQIGGTIGDSIGTGLGAAAAVFVQPAGTPARIGVGGSFTRFSGIGDRESSRKVSVYAQAGLQIEDNETSVVPYIIGSVGYTRLSDDGVCSEAVCGTGTMLMGQVRSGLELGAAVGVDIPFTETVNFDVAGTFAWLGLGDLKAGGQTISDSSTNASAFGLRAGFTIFPR